MFKVEMPSDATCTDANVSCLFIETIESSGAIYYEPDAADDFDDDDPDDDLTI